MALLSALLRSRSIEAYALLKQLKDRRVVSPGKRSERLITVRRSQDMIRRKIENVAQADPRIKHLLHSIVRLGAHACSLLLMLFAIASFDPVAAQEFPADTTRGKAVYERHCLACHGTGGHGDGPEAATLRVSPTNFHRFSSYLKSDEDLLRTIEQGVIFSPMHSWQGRLSETARHDVLAYIRLLVQQGR
jgi:mono/diheme cytochrome c family protein